MRAIRAKQIKYNTLAAMYGVDITLAGKEAILKDKQFKKVYRRAKKNYHNAKAAN